MTSRRSLLTIIFATWILSGCSSSDSDQLTMPNISGLRYVLADGTQGYTDSAGGITQSAQNVQFYLGSIPLGSQVPANTDALAFLLNTYLPSSQLELNSTLYYMDFFGRGQGLREDFGRFISNPDTPQEIKLNQLTILTNIAQLVSNFDNDKDLSNGIQIEPGVHDLIDDTEFDLEIYAYNIPDQRNLALWLKQAHDAGYITNQAMYASTVPMSWLLTELDDSIQVYSMTNFQQFDDTNTLTQQELVTLDEKGFVASYEIDNDGSSHTNWRSVNTYNQYGHALSYIEDTRENGVEDWTPSDSQISVYNEHAQEIQDTYTSSTNTSESIITRNSAGQSTQSVRKQDDILQYTETITYQENEVYRKVRLYEHAVDGSLNLTTYDVNGFQASYIRDDQSDGITEGYQVTTHNDSGKLLTAHYYLPVSYEYDTTTLEPTILTATPVLAYHTEITYNADGQTLTYNQQITVDCPINYFCESYQETHTYNNGNPASFTVAYGDGLNDYSLSYEYHDTTDIIQKKTYTYSSYTLTLEYNADGMLVLENKDSDDDAQQHYQHHYEYNDDGLLATFKSYGTLSDIQSNTSQARRQSYNDHQQPTLIEWDNDKDGIYEREYVLTYENGLLVEWLYNNIDPITSERTLNKRETFAFSAGTFNFAEY